MKIIRHVGINIQGMLNQNRDKNLEGVLEDENGKPLNHQKVTIYLHNLSVDGYKLIPRHDCEGFDPFGKGCPGHEVMEG